MPGLTPTLPDRPLDHQQAVEASLRRNMVPIVLFEAVWGLGMPFFMAGATVPAYLNALGASKWLIGLASALAVLMTPLQFLAERLLGGPNRIRNTWLCYSASGLCLVLYGAVGSLLLGRAPALLTPLTILALIVFWSCLHLSGPLYFEILTDNCPLRKRGILVGWRSLGLGLAGLAMYVPARWTYARWQGVTNFHVAMMVAGGFYAVSSLAVAFIRDHPSPAVRRVRRLHPARWRMEILGLFRRLWRNPNYRVFIFFAAMLASVGALAPFMVTAAVDVHGMRQDDVRLFNIVYLVACLFAGLLVGRIADRWGYRTAGILIAILSLAGFAVCQEANGPAMVLLAYGLFSLTPGNYSAMLCNMSVELAPRLSPSQLMAAGNALILPATFLVPVILGRCLDGFRTRGDLGHGYSLVFVVAMLLALVAGLGLATLVREPRTGRLYVIKNLPRT